MSKIAKFEKDIAEVINKHGYDSFCNMQDFILAEFVSRTLYALKNANEEKRLHEIEPPNSEEK